MLLKQSTINYSVMKYISLFLVYFLFLNLDDAFSQFEREKYGEMSAHHINLSQVPYDSSASSVVLFDVGEVYFDSQLHIIYKRHKRVKIFNESGYDQADVSVGYYSTDDLERIKNIKAQVINVSGEGKKEIIEIGKDSFFDEDIDGDYKRITFSFPAVRPGSVIEFEYEIRAKSPHLMPSWVFQESEPVLYSEFNFEIPEVFRYRILSQGDSSYEIHDVEEKTGNFRPNMAGYASAGYVKLNTTYQKVVKKNIRALREEPYMRSSKDYYSKIIFQLAELHFPNGAIEPVITTWEKVAEELYDHSYFGHAIKTNKRFRAILESIDGYPAEDKLSSMILIYDHVKKSMNWDRSFGIVASNKLHNVYERKTGNSSDINLLLFGLLNQANIEVTPVLTSTRTNGQIWKTNPFLSQFNDVLVLAEIDNEKYLLDATDPFRSYKMLPARVLNSYGWLVSENQTDWIVINNDIHHSQRFQLSADLSEDGSLNIDFSSTESGYFDLNRRKDFQAHSNDNNNFLQKEIFDHLNDISIEKSEIDGAKDEAQFKIRSTLKSDKISEKFNDLLILNPVLMHYAESNPLKSPVRTFPVDFGFEHSYLYHITINLPASYKVEELPQNKVLQLPDRGAEIRRICQAEGRSIQYFLSLKLNRSVFAPEEYNHLREFFDLYYSMTQEQIVLKKI